MFNRQHEGFEDKFENVATYVTYVAARGVLLENGIIS